MPLKIDEPSTKLGVFFPIEKAWFGKSLGFEEISIRSGGRHCIGAPAFEPASKANPPMDSAEIASFIISLLIGLIMGLIGGGGSLLLPTFIYLLKENVVLASAYTLFLVGVTAFFGAWPRFKSKEIDFATVLSLGVPILVGTLVIRYGMHYMPDPLFVLGTFEVTVKMFVMILFASILLLSFASMLGLIGKNLEPQPNMRKDNPTHYYLWSIGGGFAIGVISGVVGAGGGVMMVPLLVIVMGLDMRTVIGTSLAIMAFKSPIGFFATDAIMNFDKINWMFLLTFASIMILGVFIGSFFSKRIDGEKLKKGFAWFILAMAIFIFSKELLFSEQAVEDEPSEENAVANLNR